MVMAIKRIADYIHEFVPDMDICLRAVRHMSKTHKRDLFAKKHWPMRNAEGCFYEALIYEGFLEIAQDTNLMKGVVEKHADSPRKKPNPALGQNGLFHDRPGALVIRGHGQDLGELDLILVDNESEPIFVEVIISKKNLRGFDKEIAHKEEVLKALLGKKAVRFLIVSPIDVSNSQAVKRIVKSAENLFVRTYPLEKAKSLLNSKDIKKVQRRRVPNPKLLPLKAVPVSKAFDYLKLHGKARSLLYKVAKQEVSIKDAQRHLGKSPIVSKVIMGGLDPNAVRTLCRDWDILVHRRYHKYSEIERDFSKVVLAIGLPDLRPVLYLKVRPEYLVKRKVGVFLKLGPINTRTFRFERNVPDFVGFYMWLDSIRPSLEADASGKIVDTFLREEVTGSRKKRDPPNLRV